MTERGVMMAQKPVILQLLPALGIGGLERGAVDMAEAINQAGGRALVAAERGALVSRLRYVGGEHVEMAFHKRVSLRYFFSRVAMLRRLIRQEGVSLVHARSRYPALVAAVACRKENIPLVTTWHGDHQARFWLKKWYNSGLVRGQRVIAVSEHIGERLRKEYRVGEDRLRVIPRGSDPAVFALEAVHGSQMHTLLERWRVGDESRIVLMPGRLTRWKGQECLIEALGYLAAHHPEQEWICVMVGPGEERPYAQMLQKLAEERGIASRLRFAGVCHDMAAAYKLAHIVVVPSLRPEPFGRVPVEAQMMGRWVIGSARGGLKETIHHGETGTLVPAGDSRALAMALREVLDVPPELMAERQDEIRAHALARYTKQHMQQATLGVYDELLSSHLQEAFIRFHQERDVEHEA
ncbi:glycosyltransferase family 4 protein [Bombella sp. ESL0385]|uniref:glycosyltransferase family 4 protein n=1 Tax=Bombella sp. ESL0385 TaxID=2676446 RepID=UPI0012D98864|nr:glycosyltransferase family 4 protein [Bombella sp. ESL0385]MCT6855210.1 glycosyltransferase family 4 protein [Bombella apis]MUG89567.1 glycosyltransferase [Bombella sp. ESL0385]